MRKIYSSFYNYNLTAKTFPILPDFCKFHGIFIFNTSIYFLNYSLLPPSMFQTVVNGLPLYRNKMFAFKCCIVFVNVSLGFKHSLSCFQPNLN